MGDHLRTPGAAGVGSDTDAAKRRVDSVNLTSLLKVVKQRCPSEEERLIKAQLT